MADSEEKTEEKEKKSVPTVEEILKARSALLARGTMRNNLIPGTTRASDRHSRNHHPRG